MMKKILLTGLFAVLLVAGFAQKPYKVVFYNFENLFDTIPDPDVLDKEFTPDGPKRWNTAKYTRKIGNLERVLFDIAAQDKDYPIVIGVSEIENRAVMEDVIATPKLAPATTGSYTTTRPTPAVSMWASSTAPTSSSSRAARPSSSTCRAVPTSVRVTSSRCGEPSSRSPSSSW